MNYALLLLLHKVYGPTACVTAGWGEKSLETENYQSSEPFPKNAASPSRPVHYPGGFPGRCVSRHILIASRQ